MAQIPNDRWLRRNLGVFNHSFKRFHYLYEDFIAEHTSPDQDFLSYCCPICQRNVLLFDDEFYTATGQFSEDHFPPFAVGGQQTILTCNSCNNSAGSQYENSLVERLVQVAFQKKVPTTKLKARAVLPGVPGWRHSTVEVSNDGGHYFQLNLKPKQRIPRPSIVELDTNNFGKGWTFQVYPKQVDREKATRAFLKTAFLYCFYNWGYDFVFSEQGQFMRDCFVDEASYPVIVGEWWLDHENPTPGGEPIHEGLCFIYHPSEMRSLVVNIPLVLKSNGYKAFVPVLIPAPTPDAFERLKAIQRFMALNLGNNVKIAPVANAVMSGIEDCYTRTWHDLIRHFP